MKHDISALLDDELGEDEADPAAGKVSYVSPIARSLFGAAAGDVVALVNGETEILEIR